MPMAMVRCVWPRHGGAFHGLPDIPAGGSAGILIRDAKIKIGRALDRKVY